MAFREFAVLSQLYPTLHIVLSATFSNNIKDYDKIDKILQTLIREASYEERLDLRRLYVTQLPAFIQLYGILSVQYLKVLCIA